MTSTNVTSGTVESTTQRQHDTMMGAGWMCLVLLVVMVIISIQPTWRAKWRWGRYGTRIPMTAVGRISWILCMAIFSLRFFLEGLFGISFDLNTRHAILATCIALVVAGSIYDRRYWKQHGDK